MSESNKLVPKLRFPEFRSGPGWQEYAGSDLFDQINNRDASANLPVLAVTQEHGAIPRELIDYHVSVTEQSLGGYKVVNEGDFIISLRSFQGGIEYSRYHGICSPAYVILRLRDKAGAGESYFRHYLKTEGFIRLLTRNLEGLRDGKMISYKQFSELGLPTPSETEQRKIADCLSSLDELIAAQAGKLKALRAYKNGLMFELLPPLGAVRPNMRFPEFVDAAEWHVCPFDDFVKKSFYGTSSPTSESGSYPVLRMGNMSDGKLDYSNLAYINFDRKSFEKIGLSPGDILLNRTNSQALVGKISMFDRDMECVTASYIVAYRLDRERLIPAFCNFMLNRSDYQATINAMARPSVSQFNINPTTFRKELVISVPAVEEQQRIVSCLEVIDEQVIAANQELSALKTMKRGLLQQLFPSAEALEA